IDEAWDTVQEYRGITFDMRGYQTYAIGRDITYRNVKFTGPFCAIPTQNASWSVVNSDFSDCALEIDKINGIATMDGVTVRRLLFQSSSVDVFNLFNSNVREFINGAPKKFVGSNSTITSFNPGAYAYGFTTEVNCSNCTITSLGSGGYVDHDVSHFYSMANGTIRIPMPVAVKAEGNNGSGAIRLTVASTAAWVTGQWVLVAGNQNVACSSDLPYGVYTVTVIDGTHVDLQGATYSSGTP